MRCVCLGACDCRAGVLLSFISSIPQQHACRSSGLHCLMGTITATFLILPFTNTPQSSNCTEKYNLGAVEAKDLLGMLQGHAIHPARSLQTMIS